MLLHELFEAAVPAPWLLSWLGSSKVVDADGAPLLVYHGTSDPRFEKFARKGGLGGALGYWFATSRSAAEVFAKPRFAGITPGVKECFLRIVRPAVFQGHEAFVTVALAMGKGSPEENAKALRRKLLRAGHDGILIRDSDTDMGGLRDDWVAFEPDQIMMAKPDAFVQTDII